MAALPWILSGEKSVGRGHPTLTDVDNRPLRTMLTTLGLDPDANFTEAAFGAAVGVAYIGWLNVKDPTYGAVGDGTTDDTTAIQAAITDAVAGGGVVYIPTGRYKITATLTIPSGVLLSGGSFPGSDSGTLQKFSVLLHEFDGTFLHFTGTTGTGAGVGGGLRNLSLLQNYGSGGGAAVGRAVKFTASSDSQRPIWCRIENLNIENPSSKAPWTWGIDFDGAADTDQLRDFWISGTRIVSQAGSSGAILMTSVANMFLSGVECNLPDANISITGTGAKKSTNVQMVGCSVSGTLAVDQANNVHLQGGSFSTITNTANSGASGAPIVLRPSQLTNAFTNNAGANCYFERYTTAAATLEMGQDIDATGGYRSSVGPFTQDNVAASQTNVALVGTRWVAPRAGSITAVVVKSTEARTAGTCTVEVWKNTGLSGAAGAGVGLTAVLDGTNTSVKATTQAKDTDTFAAGDELFVVVTTDAGWLPVTADIRAFVEVEF